VKKEDSQSADLHYTACTLKTTEHFAKWIASRRVCFRTFMKAAATEKFQIS